MAKTRRIQENMVPVEAIRELTSGSFEHLAYRLKSAIGEQKEMFVGKSHEDVGLIATFPHHVIVGTADGGYFSAKYEDVEGRIQIHPPIKVDVPVVNRSNARDYVREYTLSTVDAILEGKEGAAGRVLSLIQLSESVENLGNDVAKTVLEGVSNAERPWRRLYAEQKDQIVEQIKDRMDMIRSRKMESKYVGLYDGTIPEEKFGSYRDGVVSDLKLVADRYESVQTRAEAAFLPFSEGIVNLMLAPEEDQALTQFSMFAEDFLNDMQEERENLAFGMKNEECVMCLGQIHDALAEALTDYEIAGSFIERMASEFKSGSAE